MKRLALFTVFFSLLLWVGSTCIAQTVAPTLDQSFTGPVGSTCCWWLSFAGVGPVAQVYTAGINGNLKKVNIAVSAQNGGPIVVEILDPTKTTNGTWSLLGFTTIRPPYATDKLISAVFSQTIPQVAGAQYAIAVYPGYVAQVWFGSQYGSSGYAGGGTYVNGPNWVDITGIRSALPSFEQIGSFYFQTYVKEATTP